MARGVNKVILIGHVGQEPQARYTAGGQAVVNFSLATNRRKQDANGNWEDAPDWHRIVAWEKQAEFIMQYVNKGRKLYVEGRLQTRKYSDNAGVERSITEVVAYEVIALDKMPDDGDDYEGTAKPAAPSPARNRPTRDAETFGTEDLDDVPFD